MSYLTSLEFLIWFIINCICIFICYCVADFIVYFEIPKNILCKLGFHKFEFYLEKYQVCIETKEVFVYFIYSCKKCGKRKEVLL